MRFRVLGPVEVDVDGRTVVLQRRRERCLLGVLLLELDRVVPVDRLAELLWDGEPPDRARRTIQGHVWRIRSVLAEAGVPEHACELVTVGGGYRLRADPDAVDAHRFRTLIDSAAAIPDPAARVDQLRSGLDLWRGSVLDQAASDWLRDRIGADLAERRRAAVEELMSASIALRRERLILPELAELAIAYPTRERTVDLYMQALHLVGRNAEALEVYERTRSYLAEELGIDPGRALRDRHRSILRDEDPDQVEVPDPPVAPAPEAVVPAPEAVVPAPEAVVPRQLPPDMLGFAGRARQLDQLNALLPAASDRTAAASSGAGAEAPDLAAVVIAAIGGTAGVGKTALAVHWGHRVADRFPDGQLYANLRGFDPAGQPVDPATAVRSFLDALQVPAPRIPATREAQYGLYRSLLASRRMLVVLDNARDADQVRPLLPGTGACVVVVTSRNDLSDLVAMEGAHPVRLDLLSRDEAHQLLARRLGADRVAAEPAAVDELVDRCAHLPLALAIAAARAAVHPAFPLAAIAAELRDPHGGWTAFTGERPATNLWTVFSWSYRSLSSGAARLFRLLGLHPGPEISAAAAASLAGVPLARASQLLAELAGIHLATEHLPGRYTLHDLLRAYATELVGTTDPDTDQHDALQRVLDHYLYTAHQAALLLEPHRRPLALAAPADGVTTTPMTGQVQAKDWFAAEHASLLPAVTGAADNRLGRHAWQLAWTLVTTLERRGYWRDLASVARVALRAAEELDDRTGQAHTHRGLARSYLSLGQYQDAVTELERAAKLFDQTGDRVGEADCLRNLSVAHEWQGLYPGALRYAERAVAAYQTAGDTFGLARALNSVGWCHALLADYPAALDYCRQALALGQEVDDRSGQAATLHSIGYAHHHLRDYEDAATNYRRALERFREIGDQRYQALTLASLGETLDASGDPERGRAALQQALDIYDRLGHPEADQVRARLAHAQPSRTS